MQYGEFDCWKLECPPLTCDKPLPLAPGDCCPRCEDDPCNILVGNNNTDIHTNGKPCTYKGHQYESGQQFSDMSSQCTTCACKVNFFRCVFLPHSLSIYIYSFFLYKFFFNSHSMFITVHCSLFSFDPFIHSLNWFNCYMFCFVFFF